MRRAPGVAARTAGRFLIRSRDYLLESEFERLGRLAAEIGDGRDRLVQVENLEDRVIGSLVDRFDDGTGVLDSGLGGIGEGQIQLCVMANLHGTLPQNIE